MTKRSDSRRKLGRVRDGVTSRVRSASEAASERASSVRDAATGSARSIGESNAVESIRTTSRSAVERAGEAASRGSDIARGVATLGKDVVGEGLSSARERIPWDSVLPEEARNSVLSAIESSQALSADAKRNITTRAAPLLSELFDKGKNSQAQILSILKGCWPIKRDRSGSTPGYRIWSVAERRYTTRRWTRPTTPHE